MSGERLTFAEAHVLVARTLERCRTSPENAASVARALVAAEADGLKGYGLSRVPSYAAQAKVGKVDGFATPRTSQPRPALVLVDAAAGFAYPALDAARRLLVEAARREGVAAAAVRRSHHCGAAGRTAESLAEAGLVAARVLALMVGPSRGRPHRRELCERGLVLSRRKRAAT